MPTSPDVELPQEEQAQLRAALRRARDGDVLGLHLLLWCAAGPHPTDIAAVLCGSRSSVQRTVRAQRAGTLGLEPDDDGRLSPPVRTTVLVPTRRRSLLALLKAPPRAQGWGRTRWRWATWAATFQATRGLTVAAERLRRWVHEGGWVWKRAQLTATDEAPQRGMRLARLRCIYEQWQRSEALVCADELDRHLWPTVGCAWMPQGTQLEVMTPGTNEKHCLAGALALATGTVHHALGPRKPPDLFRELWQRLDEAYPVPHYTRISVVVDHDKIPQAKAVEPWLAKHPRLELRFLPTEGPRANPLERAFGDVHDLCTRQHTRKRWRDLGAHVVEPLQVNGPWRYNLSDISHDPAVTTAVESMTMEQTLVAAD